MILFRKGINSLNLSNRVESSWWSSNLDENSDELQAMEDFYHLISVRSPVLKTLGYNF